MTQTNSVIAKLPDDREGALNAVSASSESDLDGSIQARWLAALQQSLPNLAKPIAVAMVDGAAHGSAGKALASIEYGLIQIEHADLKRLTGSEVKVLTAILRQMTQAVNQLEREITRLYVVQDN